MGNSEHFKWYAYSHVKSVDLIQDFFLQNSAENKHLLFLFRQYPRLESRCVSIFDVCGFEVDAMTWKWKLLQLEKRLKRNLLDFDPF